MNQACHATLTVDEQKSLRCAGPFTTIHLDGVLPTISQIVNQILTEINEVNIDGSDITAMDSGGAWVLCRLEAQLKEHHKTAHFIGFQEEQLSLLTRVRNELKKVTQPAPLPKPPIWLERLGKDVVSRGEQYIAFIGFFGEIIVTMWDVIRHPQRFQWRAFLNVIDETGFQALGIVALLLSLIGVVLAYQAAQQLETYGATTYIVPLLGIGVLQEFGPLITAIIVAGRTGSAFAAQIGSMQVNEEIDALRTMGLSAVNRLVIPKVFGLLVALPLLVIWADMFGLLGGIVVSNHMLHIGFYGFMKRLPSVVELSTFINGLVKAPVFAMIISSVGCFQGFQVRNTADSVGRQTTKSVVQAIFLIIVADSIFSIIEPWQNI